MLKQLVLVALCGVAFSAARTLENGYTEPDKIVYVLEDGTVVEEDLTQPIPETRGVDVNKLHFILYHQTNRDAGYELKIGDVGKLQSSGFDRNLPTKILIHGYTNEVKSDAVQIPKNAYLAAGKYNIIGVDYKEYNAPYLSAVSNAKPIAENIAKLIAFLADNGYVQIDKVHLIGHSLGAQIAGFVNQYTGSPKKIGRISGLDPAGPLFGTSGVNGRLDSSDANFVDVIHSSIKALGISYSVGHADFWPNGGSDQPRCGNGLVEELVGGCDHGQSFQYYADSIANKGMYYSKSCKDDADAKKKTCTGSTPAIMGDAAEATSPPGIYYVDVVSILK